MSMTPKFEPGKNIAVKVPLHRFEATVSFYRDILGLAETRAVSPDRFQSVTFDFGGKNLWIDAIEGLSQAEVWLEVTTDDLDAAARYLSEKGVTRRDEVEPLPEGFRGFWVSSPCDIIHLIEGGDDQ